MRPTITLFFIFCTSFIIQAKAQQDTSQVYSKEYFIKVFAQKVKADLELTNEQVTMLRPLVQKRYNYYAGNINRSDITQEQIDRYKEKEIAIIKEVLTEEQLRTLKLIRQNLREQTQEYRENGGIVDWIDLLFEL